MKLVAYLAHPVGPGRTLEELEARRENIANALGWLKWLVDHTEWSISVPWLPYVQTLDEGTYRERGIADDLAGLARCDLLVGAGGRWSAGMTEERGVASGLKMPIVDLTSFGFRPPILEDESRALAYAIRQRAAEFRPLVRSFGSVVIA